MPKLPSGGKEESNPGSLDCKSGIVSFGGVHVFIQVTATFIFASFLAVLYAALLSSALLKHEANRSDEKRRGQVLLIARSKRKSKYTGRWVNIILTIQGSKSVVAMIANATMFSHLLPGCSCGSMFATAINSWYC